MGEHVTLTAEDGHQLNAYVARPDGPAKGGLVVVQEIFGVNAHIRAVVDGFAAEAAICAEPRDKLAADHAGGADDEDLHCVFLWPITRLLRCLI